MDDTETREAIDALLAETILVVERLYDWAVNRLDAYFTMPAYDATQRLMEAHDALIRAQSELQHDRENDEAHERKRVRLFFPADTDSCPYCGATLRSTSVPGVARCNGCGEHLHIRRLPHTGEDHDR